MSKFIEVKNLNGELLSINVDKIVTVKDLGETTCIYLEPVKQFYMCHTSLKYNEVINLING